MSRPAHESPPAEHIPRKRFGQNFLTDRNILHKIVAAGEVKPTDVVLEIGPGRGHLTRVLAETKAQVVAVELDRDLLRELKNEFLGVSNVHLLEGDVLKKSPEEWLAEAQLVPPYLVVANIPYYITSAILRYLLESTHPPARIVVMVQKEVAQLMVAKPPRGNLLGTSIQFYGQPKVILNVPAGAFYPRPAVNSAVVRVDVRSPIAAKNTEHHSEQDARQTEAGDADRFFRVVRAGFGSKRKQLRNALTKGLGIPPEVAVEMLARAGIDSARRAETLSLAEWEKLAQQKI